MSRHDAPAIRFHEDARLFREAVSFTAAQTGFAARLVEKDYFCTLLLAHLAPAMGTQVVFKGGTCLAKVHVDFYRLSEDLDFAIPLPVDASRARRSRCAEAIKGAIGAVADSQPAFRLLQPLRGASNCTQYIGTVGYDSPTTAQAETIKVEVSLREPLLTPVLSGSARTVLLDPITGTAMVPEVALPCISMMEALAEKFRAALTRREAAIRDFYDIDHTVRQLSIDVRAGRFVELVRRKLLVPGNAPVVLGANRLAELGRQMPGRLKPVLRQQDFDAFDLDRAFGMVTAVGELVA